MSGTEANLEELSALAARIRHGAGQLDNTAAPPPAPQAARRPKPSPGSWRC